MKKLIAPIFLAVVLAACGPSTKITKSWRDPAFTVDRAKLNKVLVVALMKDETSRRVVEENLVKRMNGKGVASYAILTKDVTKDNEKEVEDKLKADGFDGALVMRFLNMEKETSYVPGTAGYPGYYGRFGGYYGYSYGAYSSPGYYTQDKVYTIETNVYSLTNDKLVWTGVTQTTNPDKLDKMVTEIADVVTEKMKKEGFLVN